MEFQQFNEPQPAGFSPDTPQVASLAFFMVSPLRFRRLVAEVVEHSPFYRANLTLLPDYSGHTCWVTGDAHTGFALSPQDELVNVFSRVKARGDALLRFAVRSSPRLHLNCIGGGYLEQLYSRHGFEVYRREPNWTPGAPDVLFMKRGDFTP